MTSPSPQSLAPARRAVPFLAPLQREFDRMWPDFGGFDLAEAFGPSPRMDLRETDTAVELTVEVPGLDAKDLHVELQDDVLTISGDKKTAAESSERGYRFVERRHGRFARSIRLPTGVKAEKIHAALENGLLTVTAPFDGGEAERKVQIPIRPR